MDRKYVAWFFLVSTNKFLLNAKAIRKVTKAILDNTVLNFEKPT